MRRRKTHTNQLLRNDGHLTEETIAFCSESLFLGKMELLDVSIKDHLKECLSCKEEVFAVFEEIKSNDTIKAELGENTHKKLIRSESKLRGILWVSIAASMLLIGSSIYYFLIMAKPEKETDSNKTAVILADSLLRKENTGMHDSLAHSVIMQDSLSDKNLQQYDDKEVMASNLKESEFYENLISSGFRGENTLKVAKPEIGQYYNLGENIEFEFTGDLSLPIELTIYRNSGEKLLRKDSINVPVYICQLSLSEGLYYWKVRVDKQLTDVGKFYIR